MMRKNKKIFYGFLAFFIPFIILTIIFCLNGLFSDNTIIRGDAFAQYYPLFNYLKGILSGTNSLFYSFSKNLGGTMYGTFFYYLSSPLNLFIKFINVNDISLFVAFLIIVKMSLCSLTMFLYMNYKYNNCNLILLMFSICYALMGYNINFFINIMWLDVVIMAPIVLLGLDKLINKQSPTLYVISLFISIFCNYYISYMLCIFCIVYFIYQVLLKYDNKSDRLFVTKRFLIFSLLTGLMCSFFLIPCFVESRNYFRSLNAGSIFVFDYNIFDIFSKTYIGSIDFKDILNYSSMNLYCGIIMIPLVYLFLVNENISKKKRKLTLLVLIFMILPCFVFPLNYVWHLFSKPYFYSYRYSFLLCFFIINIAYQSYSNFNINKLKVLFYLVFYLIISFYFILITHFGNYYDFLNYKMIWITLTFLFIYLLLFKIKNSSISKILLCILLLTENILNLSIIFNKITFFSKDGLNYSVYSELVDKYRNERVEFSSRLTGNDSLLMNYYGINNFLSTNNNRVLSFFTQLGFKRKFTDQNIYTYQDGQYILDSLIGLKYIISTNEMKYYSLVERVSFDDKEYYIYENPNSLGLGYMIKDECNNIEYDFNYDEKVFNCLFGFDKKIYREYDIHQNENLYSSFIKNDTNFYLFYPNIVDTNISSDDDLISYTKNYILFENSEKNYKFQFSGDDIDKEKLKIYYFDFERFKSQVNKINKDNFSYKIVNNKIVGSINSDSGLLMITIPYEKGFIIKVDGKNVDYKEVLDTFIGIDLTSGYHNISIEYSQPYLKLGVFVSILSFGLILVYVKYDKKSLLNYKSIV